MIATVYVTRVSDSETRSITGEHFWSDHEGADYIWDEGNYACDCNRANFFAEGGGETRPDQPCSFGASPRAFRVRIEVDGKTVYEDDEGT